MKKVKILALVLACLMLVSVFVGCGEPTKPTEETTKSGGDVVEELAALEAKNYNNHEFVVLWPEEHPDGHWIHNEIDYDEQSSDRINDTVYKRNLKVENDYNITISSIIEWCTTIPDRIRTDAVSEKPEYDAFFTSSATNTKLRSITIENLLADWNDLEYYKEDMVWWDHDLMQDYSLGGAKYYAFGDIIYSDNFYPYMIYYNRDMLDLYNLEDNFADLVNNKEWTIDKLIELCEGVSTENGDGVWDEDDTYGCLVSNTVVRALYYGFGKEVTHNDADGYPTWVMTPSAVATVAPKIRDFFHNDNICANTNAFEKSSGTAHADISRDMFMNNQGLFTVAELIFAERLSKNSNTVSYGILPMPLYDKNQDEYICILNDITVLSIPANQDPTRTSHILSALSRESVETLTPVFFGIVLQAKYLNDPQSVSMLKKILTTLKAQDVATRFQYGHNIFNQFINMIVNGNTDFQSIYDQEKETFEQELSDLRDQLEYYQNR